MGGKSSKPKDKKPTDKKVEDKKNVDKKADKKPAEKKVDNKKVDKKAVEAAVLKEEEIAKITSNTRFNRDQVVEVHKEFIKDCPTGKINKKDFAKLFKSLHPLDSKSSKADKYCEFAFNAYDRNHDGNIDFEEFCVAFFVISSGDAKEKVQFAFRHFDADRDGKINKNDLIKVVSSLYDLNGIPESARKGDNDPKKRVDDAMKRLDVNKKNSVTQNEFVDACLNDQSLKEFLVDSFYSN